MTIYEIGHVFGKHVVNCLIFPFLGLLHLAGLGKKVFFLPVFINTKKMSVIGFTSCLRIYSTQIYLRLNKLLLVKNNDLVPSC